MTSPSHLAGGYLVLRFTQSWWAKGLEIKNRRKLWGLGLVLSVGIDLDIVISGGILGHHQQLTHYPFFWVTLSSILFVISRGVASTFILALSKVALLAAIMHLVLDLFGITMGVWLFWPFEMGEYSLTTLTEYEMHLGETELWKKIVLSPTTLILDTIMILIGIGVYIFSKEKSVY